MSAYVTFYLYHKDEFIYFTCWCRSSYTYQAISRFIDYGKCEPVTNELFEDIYHSLARRIKEYEDSREKILKDIEFVQNCNNTLEEKLDQLFYYKRDLEQCEEEIDQIKFESREIMFMKEAASDMKFYNESGGFGEAVFYCAHECEPYIKNESEE